MPEHTFFLSSSPWSCSRLQNSEVILSHSPYVVINTGAITSNWTNQSFAQFSPLPRPPSPIYHHPSLNSPGGIQNSLPNLLALGHPILSNLPKHIQCSRTFRALHHCSWHHDCMGRAQCQLTPACVSQLDAPDVKFTLRCSVAALSSCGGWESHQPGKCFISLPPKVPAQWIRHGGYPVNTHWATEQTSLLNWTDLKTRREKS